LHRGTLSHRNSVFQIGYHIVWCVKYRKRILTGQLANDVKALLVQIAQENGFRIDQMEVMPDHVHICLSWLHLID